jgi:steroid delta-isomerase-like uncharacterized protein
MSTGNEALARRWFEDVWNRRLSAAVDELAAADCIGHQTDGLTRTLREWRLLYQEILDGFPDLRFIVEDVVSSGESVVVRWRFFATHAGTVFGVPATHTKVDVPGITWFRCRGGKVVESWDGWNQERLVQQLASLVAGYARS